VQGDSERTSLQSSAANVATGVHVKEHVTEEFRSLLWAAHKVASMEHQALGLAGLMLARDSATRILASAELFEILHRQGSVLLPAEHTPPKDPLAFLGDTSCQDGAWGVGKQNGSGGSVFEAHELSNLVQVFASSSLKEQIRLAALQQLLQLVATSQNLAKLLRAGLLEALLDFVRSPTSASLLAPSLELLLALLAEPNTRQLVCQWEHVKSVCNLLFHPMQTVRRQAALCACRLALAPERIKAAFYRQTNVVERELDYGNDTYHQALQSSKVSLSLSLSLSFSLSVAAIYGTMAMTFEKNCLLATGCCRRHLEKRFCRCRWSSRTSFLPASPPSFTCRAVLTATGPSATKSLWRARSTKWSKSNAWVRFKSQRRLSLNTSSV
jgi:hypothetical protein